MLCGCNDNYNENYIYKEGDFSLVISANKTTDVSAGETIELKATLKNLSGEDISIESFSNSIENIINFHILNAPLPDEAIPNRGNVKRKKFNLKKDLLISRTREFLVEEEMDTIECFAIAYFYIGNSKISTTIKSENIIILI